MNVSDRISCTACYLTFNRVLGSSVLLVWQAGSLAVDPTVRIFTTCQQKKYTLFYTFLETMRVIIHINSRYCCPDRKSLSCTGSDSFLLWQVLEVYDQLDPLPIYQPVLPSNLISYQISKIKWCMVFIHLP